MAACIRNMTLVSSSLLKSTRNSPVSGYIRVHYVIPKRNHSGLLSNSWSCRQHLIHKHKQHVYNYLLSVRHASTEAPSLPQGYIPDVPISPMEDLTTALPELNALGEPTLQCLGLGGNSPAGLVQQVLELLHVSLDIPWWGAIGLGALAMRTLLFPLMVYNRKSTINMRNHMPTIARLQTKIGDAKALGDKIEVARRTMELTGYMKRNDVKLSRIFLMPAVQVPILLSVYLGIKRMSELPLESMKTGGLGWFTDLTVADPFYLLSASTALSILLMFELGTESQKSKDLAHGMKWMMRGIPVLIFFVTSKFASGIVLYWSVNNLLSLLMFAILKSKRVQNVFNIPAEVVHKKEFREKKGFVEGFTDMYQTSKLSSEIVKRRQVDDTAFKKAGVGPVPKTYSYNPVKKQQQKAAA